MSLFVGLILLMVLGAGWIYPVSRNAAIYIYWSVCDAPPVTRGSVNFRAAAISYRAYGTGPPLVLLHGGLSSSFDWFSQVPYFSARGWRVILIDTRGHGRSTMGDARFTYTNLAADVIEVLDRLGVDKANFLGWSDGGNTVLRLAQQYPPRVDRIVLISANYSPAGLTDTGLDNLDSGWPQRLLRTMSGSGSARLVEKVTQLWKNHPQLAPNDLHTITAPTLVVFGENDYISRKHADEMVAALPRAELYIVPGAGHHSLMTHAGELNTSLQRFLHPGTPSR